MTSGCLGRLASLSQASTASTSSGATSTLGAKHARSGCTLSTLCSHQPIAAARMAPMRSSRGSRPPRWRQATNEGKRVVGSLRRSCSVLMGHLPVTSSPFGRQMGPTAGKGKNFKKPYFRQLSASRVSTRHTSFRAHQEMCVDPRCKFPASARGTHALVNALRRGRDGLPQADLTGAHLPGAHALADAQGLWTPPRPGHAQPNLPARGPLCGHEPTPAGRHACVASSPGIR